jgi:hypothetical protein
MQYRFILSTLLLLWADLVFAQQGPVSVTVSRDSAKLYSRQPHEDVSSHASSLYEKANQYYHTKDYERACKTMQEAINASPTYRNAYSALGEWYFKMRKYDAAVEVFKAGAARCPDGKLAFSKPLAKSLIYFQSPGEALAVLNSNAPTYDKTGEWKQLRDQCNFMLKELGKPIMDTVMNMGIRINTNSPELYPYMTSDTTTLHFTRRVKGVDEDFFYATADSCGGWFTARNKGMPPNTFDHEYAQTFSVDGHYMFYTKCENRSENGWDKGGCDLYMQYRKDTSEQWSVPQEFGATINSPAYEGMACLSPDNRELFFVSDRAGGIGGKDIWVSRFEEGRWQAPRNAGAEINTKGNETAPYLHMDNRTLYFASDGLAGMGGSDLHYSKRVNDTTWSKPRNMGYPINTPADEQSINLTEDGRRAYFASDRNKTPGDYDLYEAMVPAEAMPVPVCKLTGYVYDSFSKERLIYTAIFIYDAQTSEELYHFNSNRGDASFMITLPIGKEYIYRADGIGHMETTQTIKLTEKETNFNIVMFPDGYVEPVLDSVLFTIHFPLNSSSLTDEDKAIISNALQPWLMDPGAVIHVNGYTDSRGNPLLNEQLSFERARLVASEISLLSFNPDNMQVKGWGESSPVADNETEEGQAQNRRVEVILSR